MPNRLIFLMLGVILFSSFTAKHAPFFCNLPEPARMIIHADDIFEFNAISDGKKVFVNWASGNEKKYDYFTVEKAKDGIHFETAAMVKSGGNSESRVNYIDVDYSPYKGISYYRIRQTDYSGEVSYSDVVRVNYQFTNDGTIVSCTDFEPIDINKVDKKEILVVLRDSLGTEHVSKIVLNQNGNGNLYATDTKHNLSKGSYTVIASSYNRLFSQSVIVR